MASREDLIKRSIEQGLRLGCPPDQVENFIRAGYFPTLKQWEGHAAARAADKPEGARYVGLGGARGGAKSHFSLAQVGLDDSQRMPGSKHLFLRKIGKAAEESFEDLITRIFIGTPHEYVPSKGRLRFPNGSRIILGGFKDPSDIDKYLGIQYDTITIEEATQLTEYKFDLIDGSLRTSRNGWRPRLYLTTNPGGIGHAWFKRRLVMPYRLNQQTITKFIPSTYKDNPFLDDDYRLYLERLTGNLGKAWREGDWDVYEGQAFPQFNDEDHVIKPIELPDWWVRWRAIDWGYAAPMACLWFAKDPNTGTIYVYREFYKAGVTDPQQVTIIKDSTPPEESITLNYADPSLWKTDSSKEVLTSTAQTYTDNGLVLSKAINNRVQGKQLVDQVLALKADGKPGLQIFSTCVHLISQMHDLIYDENQIEDVDTDLEDHAYDALRYGLTNTKLKPKNDPDKLQHKRKRSPLAERFG